MLALGGGASNISRDTHCATCHELVFLKLYLAFFSNTSYMFLFQFGNYFKKIWQHYGNTLSANLKKKSGYRIVPLSRSF